MQAALLTLVLNWDTACAIILLSFTLPAMVDTTQVGIVGDPVAQPLLGREAASSPKGQRSSKGCVLSAGRGSPVASSPCFTKFAFFGELFVLHLIIFYSDMISDVFSMRTMISTEDYKLCAMNACGIFGAAAVGAVAFMRRLTVDARAKLGFAHVFMIGVLYPFQLHVAYLVYVSAQAGIIHPLLKEVGVFESTIEATTSLLCQTYYLVWQALPYGWQRIQILGSIVISVASLASRYAGFDTKDSGIGMQGSITSKVSIPFLSICVGRSFEIVMRASSAALFQRACRPYGMPIEITLELIILPIAAYFYRGSVLYSVASIFAYMNPLLESGNPASVPFKFYFFFRMGTVAAMGAVASYWAGGFANLLTLYAGNTDIVVAFVVSFVGYTVLVPILRCWAVDGILHYSEESWYEQPFTAQELKAIDDYLQKAPRHQEGYRALAPEASSVDEENPVEPEQPVVRPPTDMFSEGDINKELQEGIVLVCVVSPFPSNDAPKNRVDLTPGCWGVVMNVREDGKAMVHFGSVGRHWVRKSNFVNLAKEVITKGDVVRVVLPFRSDCIPEFATDLTLGLRGCVIGFNGDGNALAAFVDFGSVGKHWVWKSNFVNLAKGAGEAPVEPQGHADGEAARLVEPLIRPLERVLPEAEGAGLPGDLGVAAPRLLHAIHNCPLRKAPPHLQARACEQMALLADKAHTLPRGYPAFVAEIDQLGGLQIALQLCTDGTGGPAVQKWTLRLALLMSIRGGKVDANCLITSGAASAAAGLLRQPLSSSGGTDELVAMVEAVEINVLTGKTLKDILSLGTALGTARAAAAVLAWAVGLGPPRMEAASVPDSETEAASVLDLDLLSRVFKDHRDTPFAWAQHAEEKWSEGDIIALEEKLGIVVKTRDVGKHGDAVVHWIQGSGHVCLSAPKVCWRGASITITSPYTCLGGLCVHAALQRQRAGEAQPLLEGSRAQLWAQALRTRKEQYSEAGAVLAADTGGESQRQAVSNVIDVQLEIFGYYRRAYKKAYDSGAGDTASRHLKYEVASHIRALREAEFSQALQESILREPETQKIELMGSIVLSSIRVLGKSVAETRGLSSDITGQFLQRLPALSANPTLYLDTCNLLQGLCSLSTALAVVRLVPEMLKVLDTPQCIECLSILSTRNEFSQMLRSSGLPETALKFATGEERAQVRPNSCQLNSLLVIAASLNGEHDPLLKVVVADATMRFVVARIGVLREEGEHCTYTFSEPVLAVSHLAASGIGSAALAAAGAVPALRGYAVRIIAQVADAGANDVEESVRALELTLKALLQIAVNCHTAAESVIEVGVDGLRGALENLSNVSPSIDILANDLRFLWLNM